MDVAQDNGWFDRAVFGLVNVGGNLILDGTLNVSVSSGGSFGGGIYRVFNYDGTLTDNGLELGTMPSGSDVFVQTAIDHQVNLVNSAGLDLTFWDGDAGPKNDGTIGGGDGTWSLVGSGDNWTETTGTINAPYRNESFAVFSGTSGTVTVDNGSYIPPHEHCGRRRADRWQEGTGRTDGLANGEF